jgi:hypothetical protein
VRRRAHPPAEGRQHEEVALQHQGQEGAEEPPPDAREHEGEQAQREPQAEADEERAILPSPVAGEPQQEEPGDLGGHEREDEREEDTEEGQGEAKGNAGEGHRECNERRQLGEHERLEEVGEERGHDEHG